MNPFSFAPMADTESIQRVMAAALDRQEMLPEGAVRENVPVLPFALNVGVYRIGCAEPVGVMIGVPQSGVCLDVHVMLTPLCRGRDAVAAILSFFRWLKRVTVFRSVIGQIPVYNRPMMVVAGMAGMRRAGINPNSVLDRFGRLRDMLIVTKEL
jgi:hypothetical protein